MKASHMRLLGLLCLLAGVGILGWFARKTVTIQVDGKSHSLTTYSWTVAGALRAAHIQIRAGDEITPAPEQVLANRGEITLRRAVPISVLADGEYHQLTSAKGTPGELLTEAGIALIPGDRIFLDGLAVQSTTPLEPGMPHSLQIERARRIELHIGSKTTILSSSGATLGQALSQAGITWQAADRLVPGAQTPLSGDLQASLVRAHQLVVRFTGGETKILSAAPTVGMALAQAGLALQGLDYSQPAAEDPPPADGDIQVMRVREQVQIDEQPIPYTATTQPSDQLALDERKVIQAGQPGVKARSYRIRFEDGRQVSRTLEGEWIARQPQAQVTGVGTKVVVKSLNTSSGSIQYYRAVSMYATSYSPCRIYKGRCSYNTANGATLQKGVVALTRAMYNQFQGARLYIPGYGIASVADIGAGVPGQYWIDLGYSESDFVNWHQNVTVYFLTPVPANVPLTLP
jgi:resuscitation-promoting factor RpfB